MAFGMAHAAQEDPTSVAITDGDVEWTWPQLNSVVNRTVAWLIENVPPGRRLAVMAENSAHTALAHLAGTYAGLSVVPVNCLLTSAEAGYILRDADVHTVLCSARTAPTARAADGDVRVLAWGAPDTDGVEGFEQAIAEHPGTEPSADIRPAPPLYYTSGTTGVPKGAQLPDQMFPRGETIVEHVERLSQSGIRPVGRHLVVGPLHHTGPIGGVRGLTLGNPVVILKRFDAEAVLAAIDRHEIAHSVMVPTHFSRMLALPAQVRSRYDVSSVRTVVHTGSACPVEVKRAMIAWFGPVFVEAYGSTEAGTATVIDSIEWLAHPGSVGRALPGVEVTIRDEDGAALPAGATGLVCVRSVNGARPAYHNDSEKTLRSYLAGDFVIGEIGHLDNDGYLYLTDRASDMVVSGGVNVYPAESEAVLAEHPGVDDAAVIGIPHADLGETLCALVVASDPPPDRRELISWCRDRLAHYKCPTIVEFVDHDIRNPMGKVNKRQLRERYLSDANRTTTAAGR